MWHNVWLPVRYTKLDTERLVRCCMSGSRAESGRTVQILEDVIKFRWGALPEEQREGIKNYISNLIIKLSTDEGAFRREKVFLNKLNIILVQVQPSPCAPSACLVSTCCRSGRQPGGKAGWCDASVTQAGQGKGWESASSWLPARKPSATQSVTRIRCPSSLPGSQLQTNLDHCIWGGPDMLSQQLPLAMARRSSWAGPDLATPCSAGRVLSTCMLRPL